MTKILSFIENLTPNNNYMIKDKKKEKIERDYNKDNFISTRDSLLDLIEVVEEVELGEKTREYIVKKLGEINSNLYSYGKQIYPDKFF